MTRNVILGKYKNIFPFKNALKVENKKWNQTYFQNFNLLKMKTILKNKK